MELLKTINNILFEEVFKEKAILFLLSKINP
jgi:hypothetical protein